MKRKYLFPTLVTIVLIAAFAGYNVLKNKQILQKHIEAGLPILHKLFEGKKDLNFRGIASINDSVVWVSGNFGVFGKSLDGGTHWVFGKIPGADSLQFRDIHLYDAHTAILMGAGAPTAIYKTNNGGETWRMVYENKDTNMFLNGFDFWPDGSGIAFGDPIQGKFTILKTNDFGETWVMDTTNAPIAKYGEAGFAASGTSIRCKGDAEVYFVSGGTTARLYYSSDKGATWAAQDLAMQQGSPSQGAYSLAVQNSNLVVVGGDYTNESSTMATSVFGKNLELKPTNTLPYQSVVQFVNDTTLISAGPMGCFISNNAGETWQKFSEDGMHTLVVSEKGKKVFAAGAHGRIGWLSFSTNERE